MNTKVMTNLILLLITVFELKCTYIWCYLEFQKYFRSCWGQSCIPWKESLKAQEYWHRFWKLELEKICTVKGLYVKKKSVQWKDCVWRKNLYSDRIVCGEKKCTVIGLYVEEKNYPMSVEILKGEVKMVWWLWTILRHTDHHRKKSPV